MNNEKEGQDARMEFYGNSSVVKYIKTIGIPKRTGEFRDMVASGSTLDLHSKEGLDLIETLGCVVFAKHPQQINITDNTNGKMIASITI
jgi:hypothetical protein